MPETVVETTVTTTTTEVVEKKDLVENEAGEATTEEKKDEEKAEVKEEKVKAEKAKKVKPAPAPSVHKKDFEKDRVYLFQFDRTKRVPSFSPYCLKVETWLKLNGVQYEVRKHDSSKSKPRPFSRFPIFPFCFDLRDIKIGLGANLIPVHPDL